MNPEDLPEEYIVSDPYGIDDPSFHVQGNQNNCTSHTFASMLEMQISPIFKERTLIDIDDLWEKQKKYGTATEESGDVIDGPWLIASTRGVRFRTDSGKTGTISLPGGRLIVKIDNPFIRLISNIFGNSKSVLDKGMKSKTKIHVSAPIPYDAVGAKFIVEGWIHKSLLKTEFRIYDDRVFLDVLDIDCFHWRSGSILQVRKGWRSFLDGKLYFSGFFEFWNTDVEYIEKSQGRMTIQVSTGMNKNRTYVPIIVSEFTPREGVSTDILNKHPRVGEMTEKYSKDIENYKKEANSIWEERLAAEKLTETDGALGVDNEALAEDIFTIVDDSPDEEMEALKKKYEAALKLTGPFLKGVAGRMAGYFFMVYSDDHGKHFHVLHKEKGIDARFSYPEIELINYKNSRNKIRSKETKAIQEYFKISDNLEKLRLEFSKREG